MKDKYELEKTDGWAARHGKAPFLTTLIYIYAHTHTRGRGHTHTDPYRFCLWARLLCKEEIRGWRREKKITRRRREHKMMGN